MFLWDNLNSGYVHFAKSGLDLQLLQTLKYKIHMVR